jgi:hypothetical protein
VQVLGLVVALAVFAATLAAQTGMGASWRIGVDPSERPKLVTSGPLFARAPSRRAALGPDRDRPGRRAPDLPEPTRLPIALAPQLAGAGHVMARYTEELSGSTPGSAV